MFSFIISSLSSGQGGSLTQLAKEKIELAKALLRAADNAKKPKAKAKAAAAKEQEEEEEVKGPPKKKNKTK